MGCNNGLAYAHQTKYFIKKGFENPLHKIDVMAAGQNTLRMKRPLTHGMFTLAIKMAFAILRFGWSSYSIYLYSVKKHCLLIESWNSNIFVQAFSTISTFLADCSKKKERKKSEFTAKFYIHVREST